MKYQDILKKITIIFLILFPLSGLSFFHHNLTNLFIVLFIFFLFISIIFINKKALKYSKYLFLYYIICFLYLIINYFLNKNFISLIPDYYSFYKESLTIIKLIMPITFLYSLYFLNLKQKEYIFIVKIWTIIISLSIIITNIFKISLSSYSNDIITYNIFSWYKNPSYLLSASKVFFTYANQVALILLCLLIVMTKEVLIKKRNIIYLILIMLSMLMLGTRLSSLGSLLTLICLFIFYFIIIFIKKEKINNNIYFLLIPIILSILLIPISPFNNRIKEINEYQEYEKDHQEENILNDYNPNYLPSYFFEEYYSIEYDPEFWVNFTKETKNKNINYRYIEQKIIERMIEINNKKRTIFFGISNSRIQNVVNLERDFLMQYYAYGLIGSFILLINYLILLIKYSYYFVKKQDYDEFINLTLVCLFIFGSILTGNILFSLFPTITFSFLISKKVA